MQDLLQRMRRDWDTRARENAKYYVACQRWDQSDSEFYGGAPEIIARVRRDYTFLAAHPSDCRFLEIGCGLGRLMAPLAADCREIHGVDISPEMILAAKAKLRDLPNAHFTVAENSDLSAYPDSYFDLAYSYAVFQHIPDRCLILRYVDEALRVLNSGGIFIGHFNGTAPFESRCDTWVGSWISEEELLAHCREKGWRVLCRDGANSPYLWLTIMKPGPRTGVGCPISARITTVCHVSGGNDLVAGGPTGFATIYCAGIPDEFCSVTELSVLIGSKPAPICYIGPAPGDGPRQINIQVPEDTPAGEQDLVLRWNERPISNSARVNVTPHPLAPPRLVAVTDGRDILAKARITCGIIQVSVVGCRDIGTFSVTIGGVPAEHTRGFCVEPLSRYYHVNIFVPTHISGMQPLQISVDGYQLSPVEIEIRSGEKPA